MNIEWKGPIIKASKKNNDDESKFEWTDKKGVYVIANTFGKTDQIARYVGKGIITERISDHKKSDEECMDKATDEYRHIYYAVISDETDRSNIEHTLYHKYGGDEGKLCNEKEPDGKIIDINYPPNVIPLQ